MPVTLWSTETKYVANQLTFIRGTAADVVNVGVYHNTDPNVVPEEVDFTVVPLIVPPDALAEGTKIDILSLIGPAVEAHVKLDPNPLPYQRWGLVKTNNEVMLFKIDTVTVTGPVVP